MSVRSDRNAILREISRTRDCNRIYLYGSSSEHGGFSSQFTTRVPLASRASVLEIASARSDVSRRAGSRGPS